MDSSIGWKLEEELLAYTPGIGERSLHAGADMGDYMPLVFLQSQLNKKIKHNLNVIVIK